MKGRGLEYLYFSVHDDDIDGNRELLLYLADGTFLKLCPFLIIWCVTADHTRCNAWVLDGDLYHKGLQGVAVPVDAISDTLLLITVDMSRPWNALDSLQKWAAVAREHIDKLRVPPETLREMEHRRKSDQREKNKEGVSLFRGTAFKGVCQSLFSHALSCQTVPGVHGAGQRRGRRSAEEGRGRGERAAALRRRHAHAQSGHSDGGGVHEGRCEHARRLVSRSLCGDTFAIHRYSSS